MSDLCSPVAVVGAGVSGLACAVHLHEAGMPVQVFEAGREVGGRVRTDLADGFRIDGGFPVLPTAYPEVQAMLDLGELVLCRFTPVRWPTRAKSATSRGARPT
jgi:phytoene dehydrogenase-like protein